MLTWRIYGQFQRHGHYIPDNVLDFRSLLHIFAKCKSKSIHNHYKQVIMEKAPYEVDAIIVNRISDIVYNKASKKLSNRRRTHSNQPGWNDHVADLHKDARECFAMWCNNGKPRQGWIFDLMCQTRSQFKYALPTVKNNENVLRRESLV